MKKRGRKPSVRYWESRGAYCCWIGGSQYTLATGPDDAPNGETYLQALDRFRELLSAGNAEQAKDSNTIKTIFRHYLGFIQTRRKLNTYKMRHQAFEAFCNAGYGETKISALTLPTIYGFIDQKKARGEWNDTTVGMFLQSLTAAFRWSIRAGLITRNPIADIERPTPRKRSAEVVISPATYRRIVDAASKSLRPVLVLLWMTGARPGEICAATARDFDPSIPGFRYKASDRRAEDEFSHKTSKSGRDRVIYLTGEALEIVKALVAERPEGSLFLRKLPGSKGERVGFTIVTLCSRVNYLAKKLGIRGLSAYGFRHSFCTHFLENGGAVADLCALVGNSPGMIERHYGHLYANRDRLRSLADRFSAVRGDQSADQA